MLRRDAANGDEKPQPTRPASGGTAQGSCLARQASTAPSDQAGDETTCLMEQVVQRSNLLVAYARVVRNGGAPGVDAMTVTYLEGYSRSSRAKVKPMLDSFAFIGDFPTDVRPEISF